MIEGEISLPTQLIIYAVNERENDDEWPMKDVIKFMVIFSH